MTLKWKWDIVTGVGSIFIGGFILLIIGSVIAKNYEGLVTWTIALLGFLGLGILLLQSPNQKETPP